MILLTPVSITMKLNVSADLFGRVFVPVSFSLYLVVKSFIVVFRWGWGRGLQTN